MTKIVEVWKRKVSIERVVVKVHEKVPEMCL